MQAYTTLNFIIIIIIIIFKLLNIGLSHMRDPKYAPSNIIFCCVPSSTRV